MDLAAALEALYDEVSFIDFYRDIFPEGSLEKKGEYVKGQYTGIAVSVPQNGNRVERYTITDDLDTIADLAATDNFCLMSPISYAGKARKAENARYMYAMAIDLDGIDGRGGFDFLMTQCNYGHEMRSFVWGLPKPTYLVSSGTGIHIYYVFKEPVPLYRNVAKELEKLKRRLTWQAWTQGASALHDFVQYESLFQGFRMVGTITKTGTRCRAFRFDDGEKVTVDYLNYFVPQTVEHMACTDFSYKSKMSLADAKERFPEWYQTRITEGKPRGTWVCKKAVYDWWVKKVDGEGEPGHRYWCIVALAAYAKKCGVDRDTLEGDAFRLRVTLDARGGDKNPFTADDVLHALTAYTDDYITYPISTISVRCGIRIDSGRRNYRKQIPHLKRARAVQDIDYPNGEWRNKNGRPPKGDTVKEWQRLHPEGRKADCIRDTGLNKRTVYKYWNCTD